MWVWFDRALVSWTHHWSRWFEGGYGENKAIIEWPRPKNLIELRGFIGNCTYYKKFVKGFSQLTSPLTDLTKKDAFQWHEVAEKYFQRMKEVIRNCLILALPDFSNPSVLECDATGEGIGAVLKQGKHPINFESR